METFDTNASVRRKRAWYTKKRYIGSAVLVAAFGGFNALGSWLEPPPVVPILPAEVPVVDARSNERAPVAESDASRTAPASRSDTAQAASVSASIPVMVQVSEPAAPPAPQPEPKPTPKPATSPACCKYCTTGKACGDSCISRSYTCHKGPGCACNR